MIDKLTSENQQLKEELIAQSNQMQRVKSSASERNLIDYAEEIKMIKEEIEMEKQKQDQMRDQRSIIESKRK